MTWEWITSTAVAAISIFNWSWITSTAVAAILVFGGNWYINECKEKKRFRVCCQLLYTEVKSHKPWLDLLTSGNQTIIEVQLKTAILDENWVNLKYDPVLLRMEFTEFEIITNNYLTINGLKRFIRITTSGSINHLPPKVLETAKDTQSKARTILLKYAKPTLQDVEDPSPPPTV